MTAPFFLTDNICISETKFTFTRRKIAFKAEEEQINNFRNSVHLWAHACKLRTFSTGPKQAYILPTNRAHKYTQGELPTSGIPAHNSHISQPLM